MPVLHDNLGLTFDPAKVMPAFLLLTGIACTLKGIAFSVYVRPFEKDDKRYNRLRLMNSFLSMLDKATSVFPLHVLKSKLRDNPVFMAMDNTCLPGVTSLVSTAVLLSGLGLLKLLYRPETLWYVKLLVVAMSFFLPLYVTFLVLDIWKYHVEKQIPRFIDEFRSAFVKHRKIKPALLESCSYIDKSLGRIIYKAADGVFIEKSLEVLKERINNVWFNIFVILLSNYKQNGGILIDQLYRLNRTMSRYVNIEKKRSKRLIWYESFAVTISAFSIPSIIWLNGTIANNFETAANPDINFIMARLIFFTMICLLFVRILRRM